MGVRYSKFELFVSWLLKSFLKSSEFYSGGCWATWCFNLSSPLLGVYYCLTQQFGIKGHISEEGDWKKRGNVFGISRPEVNSYDTDSQGVL